MDFTSLIEIIIAIVIAYFLIKFIVSPIIKLIIGVIIFLVLISLLQRFFGFDLDKTLAPFGIYLNLNKWNSTFNWILGPVNYCINYCIDQIKNLLKL